MNLKLLNDDDDFTDSYLIIRQDCETETSISAKALVNVRQTETPLSASLIF